MVDRFLVRLGAGMVTAGVAAAMVAGAGVAIADTPPGSDANGTTSSESAKPAENKADSDNDSAGTPKPNPSGEKPEDDATADRNGVQDTVDDTDASGQSDEDKDEGKTEPPAHQPDHEPAVKDSDTAEKLADQPVKPVAREPKPAAKPSVKQRTEEPQPDETTESTAFTDTPVEPVATVVPTLRNSKVAAATLNAAAAPETAAVAFAAPANAEIASTAAAPPLSGLLSAIGTLFSTCTGSRPDWSEGHRSSPRTARSQCAAPRCGLTAPTDTRCPLIGTSRTQSSRRRD